MREKDFSIHNDQCKISIHGGRLWKAPSRGESGGVMSLDDKTKTLSIYLHPGDKFLVVQDALFEVVREKSLFYYIALLIKKRIPSLLLLIPIALTVTFIGFITVWGDLVINWVFLGENSPTVFGIPMNESAVIYALCAILIIYFFPVLFTGEQEGFVQALNERFANREELRKRFRLLYKYLKSKKYVERVVIWNPDLANEHHDWVGKSLLTALLDSKLGIELHIRIDERRLVENYFQKKSKKELTWEEQPLEKDVLAKAPIAYEYLEHWEKNLLAVYVFSSTASLSSKWKNLEGHENDGILVNAVSLRLVKLLIDRFKKRIFSGEDLKKMRSLDLFASRCLNDYGILKPMLRYTNDVWAICQEIVDLEKEEVEEEMKFMASFLQTDILEIIDILEDPVSALKLSNAQEKQSIYNDYRLAAIRFFVKVIYQSEQYKILKQYWPLVIDNPTEDKDMNEDIYRIIGVDLLLSLATIFERAAMYEHAQGALDYVERIFPFRGKVGKARIKERQGNFEESVLSMLKIKADWKNDRIHLNENSLVDLNLDISWAIVSGRLENQRTTGRTAIKDAQDLLYSNFDTIRNSDQTIRLYNILANYEEWEGKPYEAIENYNKALQIPGVQQAGLSNLLVNKGIALRQMKQLEDGAMYGEQGVEIKTAIGDADQLPIALHNLAQTYIELAFSIVNKEDKKRYFSKAIGHALTGLNIQAQTGSVKKRGQLLAEKFVGEYQIAKINKEDLTVFAKGLENVQNWLKNEAHEGRGDSYDCRVVVGELLGIMPEFKGKTLEDALAWTIIAD